MSKNSQGYMGPQIGKLGPAIGYLWKGRQVFRGYNPFVKDRTSETVYIGGGTVEEMEEAYREEPEPGLPEATDGQPQVAESLTQSGTDFSSPETAIPRDAARGPS